MADRGAGKLSADITDRLEHIRRKGPDNYTRETARIAQNEIVRMRDALAEIGITVESVTQRRERD